MTGARSAMALLAGLLVATLAVVTALPGPGVGPIPATGLISLQPDVYLLLYAGAIVAAAWSLGSAGGREVRERSSAGSPLLVDPGGRDELR
jgi:hypothetical protein